MHELSIVMSILDIADKESERNHASGIEEIELDIGELSGIDLNAFDFAWQQAIKSTKLENAARKINHVEGEGKCMDCETDFMMHNLYDSCPNCGDHFINIQKGKELRVRSLTIN